MHISVFNVFPPVHVDDPGHGKSRALKEILPRSPVAQVHCLQHITNISPFATPMAKTHTNKHTFHVMRVVCIPTCFYQCEK